MSVEITIKATSQEELRTALTTWLIELRRSESLFEKLMREGAECCLGTKKPCACFPQNLAPGDALYEVQQPSEAAKSKAAVVKKRQRRTLALRAAEVNDDDITWR